MARSNVQKSGKRKGARTPNRVNVGQSSGVLPSQLCSLAPTPILVENLVAKLENYPNRKAAQFLQSGFVFGFDLNYIGPRMPVDFPNLKSVE